MAYEEASSSSDTAQALVAHVKAEADKERKARDDEDQWRRWWHQSTYLNLDTWVIPRINLSSRYQISGLTLAVYRGLSGMATMTF
jgi:alpha-L-arabinofuranosidase